MRVYGREVDQYVVKSATQKFRPNFLYPDKQTISVPVGTSSKCHKRTNTAGRYRPRALRVLWQGVLEFMSLPDDPERTFGLVTKFDILIRAKRAMG